MSIGHLNTGMIGYWILFVYRFVLGINFEPQAWLAFAARLHSTVLGF